MKIDYVSQINTYHNQIIINTLLLGEIMASQRDFDAALQLRSLSSYFTAKLWAHSIAMRSSHSAKLQP